MITVLHAVVLTADYPRRCPDTSYLGEYSNTAKTEWAIDRVNVGIAGGTNTVTGIA